MSNESLNPWILTTVGILLVGATVGATMLVGRDSKTDSPDSQMVQISEKQKPVIQKAILTAKADPIKHQRIAAQPSQSIMRACNKYANDQVNRKTEEVLTSAALGAAIGGLTGAAGGSLYGLNENKSHDAQYQSAYSSCMRSKGYYS